MTFVGVKRLVFTFRPRGSPSVVVQPCLILCNPMDCSLLGSFFHGILQARILEWVAIPSPDLPNPRTEPGSPALQADSLCRWLAVFSLSLHGLSSAVSES